MRVVTRTERQSAQYSGYRKIIELQDQHVENLEREKYDAHDAQQIAANYSIQNMSRTSALEPPVKEHLWDVFHDTDVQLQV